MNKFLSLIFLSFLFLNASAQNCPIPNGSFEEWVDISSEIDTTGSLPAETVLVPENYFPILRLFLATFEQAFGSVLDIDIAKNYLGIERSDDASDGNYSMKLLGNSTFPLADALSIFPCDGQLPSEFYLDLKHVGTGADTMQVVLTFGETPVIPFDVNDFFTTSGFYSGLVTADIDTEWSSLALPITDNEIGISADSVMVWFILESDTTSIANNEESYFLIDNMSFDIESSVTNIDLEEAVKIFPIPFIDKVSIDNNNGPLQAQLYHISGAKISSFEVSPGLKDYNLDYLHESGNYILELWSEEKNQRSSYNIIKK